MGGRFDPGPTLGERALPALAPAPLWSPAWQGHVGSRASSKLALLVSLETKRHWGQWGGQQVGQPHSSLSTVPLAGLRFKTQRTPR